MTMNDIEWEKEKFLAHQQEFILQWQADVNKKADLDNSIEANFSLIELSKNLKNENENENKK